MPTRIRRMIKNPSSFGFIGEKKLYLHGQKWLDLGTALLNVTAVNVSF